jgi:hypothetical protein
MDTVGGVFWAAYGLVLITQSLNLHMQADAEVESVLLLTCLVLQDHNKPAVACASRARQDVHQRPRMLTSCHCLLQASQRLLCQVCA